MLAMASKPRDDRSSRARDEVAGGVVDEVRQRPAGLENLADHVIDRSRIANVEAVGDHLAAMRLHQLGGGLVADRFAPAADVHLRAELQEFGGHRLAEAGAAAGDKNASALE